MIFFYTGKGITHTSRAAGATHAGRGGSGSSSRKQPVLAVGDIFTEGTWGSGGGSYQTGFAGRLGGRGGGRISIQTGTFDVNGIITMNGLNSGVSQSFTFLKFFVKSKLFQIKYNLKILPRGIL